MLIQNRIAGIDISEKIDLGRQLRHFRKTFDGCAATWDLRFDDTSQTIEITRTDQTTCRIGGKCNGDLLRAYIWVAE